jgi:hypothetical protein
MQRYENYIRLTIPEKLSKLGYNLSDEQAEFSCKARAKQSCLNFAGRKQFGQSQIRADKGDELWNGNPHKKCQKDIDARWTEKGCKKFYGYKDRVKIDSGYKLIDTYEVTSAEVRDSQPTEDLIDEKTEGGQPFYADSVCAGKKNI